MKGIINVKKPAQFTSHDCVAVMRGILGIKKIGHTGTLDPMATGVLPICIGNATRIMEYLELDSKEYRCTMKLGVVTDTCDIWGKVLEEKDTNHITEEEIKEAFKVFDGEIEQVPPKYSALKVNGRKLYEYARAGEEVEIKSRKVVIKELEIEKIEGDLITYRVVCSKGTYIRSICFDVGEALGCGGTMIALERLASGIFKIEDSVPLLELKEMSREKALEWLLPVDYPLVHFGKIKLNRKQAKDFIDGKHIEFDKSNIIKSTKYKERYKLYFDEVFIGIADIDSERKLVADKVFNTEI